MLLEYKLLGAGIATTGMGLAGVGGGIVFGAFILGLSRNPSLKNELFPLTLLGFALIESAGLFCIMMSFLFIFAF